MARTVAIHGSDEVKALFGEPAVYYRGKFQKIRVTRVASAEDTPIEVRMSLVGLVITTIFTKESIEEQTEETFPIPKESRLAYSSDVIEALKSAGKHEAARQLEAVVPDPLDMYVFEREIYELV